MEPFIPKLKCRIRDLTFLCGDMGPLCISAVLQLKNGDPKKASERVQKVLGMLNEVLKPDTALSNELLYGRVGYLYSLLFLQKYFPEISNDILRQVGTLFHVKNQIIIT